MRILVIGSGGREHALSWKIAESPKCSNLYCAPGNGGISEVAELVDIKADDIDGLLKFAKDKNIELTVVGPEVPLVAGTVNKFNKEGLAIFGPVKERAVLEGSKVFAKELMKRLNVPTADFRVFAQSDGALKYLETKKAPVVIKADGLCAGKGVIICNTAHEAKAAVKRIMIDRIFGAAGDKIIIEECLIGEEASIIVVTDGERIVPLALSQDHKRVFDGDRGPNTGGMGAYSPAPVITDELFKRILESIIHPIVRGLAKEGILYKGALYAGVMINEKGPLVLEFNTRFGDPETQAILPRLKSDLVELLNASASGTLENCSLDWDERPCVSVVIASGGYPGDYKKGMEIRGLDEAKKLKDVFVFHAGTKLGVRADDDGLYLTNGGRVLNVTALGDDMKKAVDNCYGAVRLIHFDGMHYRRDIGRRALVKTENRG